jgi:hypothetical protein
VAPIRATSFNPQTFLAKVGHGKTLLQARKHQRIFSQGDAADAVFYIQAGQVKLTIVSQQGKEAVVAILERGSFFGESCLAGHLLHLATATAFGAKIASRGSRRSRPQPREIEIRQQVSRRLPLCIQHCMKNQCECAGFLWL